MRSWLGLPALVMATGALTASAFALLTARATAEATLKDHLARHPETVQRIIKDYLVENPEVVQQAILEMIKKRQPGLVGGAAPPPKPDKSAEVKANAKLLLDSPRHVALGNPQGDVTLVEFFDYNCGYCKRALGDMHALLKGDAGLRIVLKELPILGPGSTEAARVAVAVRMQDDASGARYLAFHERMLGDRAPASKDQALAHAAATGADMARLERDLASEEIERTLQESVTLARALGITGTPAYVLDEEIISGAIGAAALRAKVAIVRKQRPG